MIEPGTLIIGVSEEGILHELQLWRGQGGTELCLGHWWALSCPNIPPLPPSTFRFTICWPGTAAAYTSFVFPMGHLSSFLPWTESYVPPRARHGIAAP